MLSLPSRSLLYSQRKKGKRRKKRKERKRIGTRVLTMYGYRSGKIRSTFLFSTVDAIARERDYGSVSALSEPLLADGPTEYAHQEKINK